MPEQVAEPFARRYGRSLDDALRIARIVLPMFPTQNCMFASLVLSDRLGSEVSIQDGFYDGMPHSFVDLGTIATGGQVHIADITSDQFFGPRMYVGPLILPWESPPAPVFDFGYIDPVSPC